MNTDEKQVVATQEDIRAIKTDVSHVGIKLDKVYDALMGNDMSKDGGLIKRIADNEVELSALTKRVLNIETEKYKTEFYIKVIIGLASAGCGGAFTYVLKLLFGR